MITATFDTLTVPTGYGFFGSPVTIATADRKLRHPPGRGFTVFQVGYLFRDDYAKTAKMTSAINGLQNMTCSNTTKPQHLSWTREWSRVSEHHKVTILAHTILRQNNTTAIAVVRST